MAVITFDTLEYSKNLEAKGFTVEQAEALAMENKRVFNEFAENQLATKADLFRSHAELDKKISIVQWVTFATFALVSASAIKFLLT